MENFLPALLIIGGVIYKIYSEYQKEQEKARRRRPNIPAGVPIPIPVQTKTPPKPAVAKPLPTIPHQKFENTALPDEVKKIQTQREQRKQSKIEIETPKLQVITEPTVSFDLRQAIIQSAILERPYQ